jgi:hypothetical protein
MVTLTTVHMRAAGLPACTAPFKPSAAPRRHLSLASSRSERRSSLRHRTTAAAGGESPSASQSLAETAALDSLIDVLMAARDPNELGRLVAENILSFDQRFWLRLAARSDTAATPEQKEQLVRPPAPLTIPLPLHLSPSLRGGGL